MSGKELKALSKLIDLPRLPQDIYTLRGALKVEPKKFKNQI